MKHIGIILLAVLLASCIQQKPPIFEVTEQTHALRLDAQAYPGNDIAEVRSNIGAPLVFPHTDIPSSPVR